MRKVFLSTILIFGLLLTACTEQQLKERKFENMTIKETRIEVVGGLAPKRCYVTLERDGVEVELLAKNAGMFNLLNKEI